MLLSRSGYRFILPVVLVLPIFSLDASSASSENTDTLTALLSKLDLMSTEHEELMSLLQTLARNNEDRSEPHSCSIADNVLRDISIALEKLQLKLGLPSSEKLLEGSGATYVRWGRTICPDVNGTTKVYDGFAAGDFFTHGGGPSELLCLPKDPIWGQYVDSYKGQTFVYGTEYEVDPQVSKKLFGKNVHDQNVPCVVCQSAGRISALRIPGRTDCYKKWTKEYAGYLMGGYHGHGKSTDYTCVDSDPEVITGNAHNQNGRLLYLVEAHCHEGSLQCPPYVHGREIPCVMCTK